MAAPTPHPIGPSGDCRTCAKLSREEREAVACGDQSRATDCRVLIARHPHEGASR
ncbi:hypothetical protein ACQYWQ_10000 [Streptomyces sp. P6-2-1]|uniref:hypothetical protein n=1 Tax=Streptomyces sp. P6-2-1 TaxID=3422591 RepID=UPI003D36887D